MSEEVIEALIYIVVCGECTSWLTILEMEVGGGNINEWTGERDARV